MNENYDFSKFSRSDLIQYRKKLERLPYNQSIQDFFEWRKRVVRKLRRADERHLSYMQFQKATQKCGSASFEDEILETIVFREALVKLTPLQRKRF